MIQAKLFKSGEKAYGGELLKKRKGRFGGRPLAVRSTMHLVLRSSKARGEWSFKKTSNEKKIRSYIDKFSLKFGVKVMSYANVGNHLHFQIKLSNRYTYKAFIRALTGAIALGVTGANKFKPLKKEAKDKFWDYRPFTRIVIGYQALLRLRDYLWISQLEGFGYSRGQAKMTLLNQKLISNTG